MRTLPSASQKVGPHQGTKSPGSWTSQPPELLEINSCHLSHLVYGSFLWQPMLTNTVTKLTNGETKLFAFFF